MTEIIDINKIGILAMIISIIIFFSSCKEDTYCKNLTTEVEKQCHEKDSCYINFENAFPFDWDSLFVISGNAYLTSEEISKMIGTECWGCDDIDEHDELIIFLKEGKIKKKLITYCPIEYNDARGIIKRNKSYEVNMRYAYDKLIYTIYTD